MRTDASIRIEDGYFSWPIEAPRHLEGRMVEVLSAEHGPKAVIDDMVMAKGMTISKYVNTS